jgi:glycerol kinase
VGLWQDQREIATLWKAERSFRPGMKAQDRTRLCSEWTRALERAKGWETAAGPRRPKGKLS